MTIATNLRGRLRNTTLPITNGLLPLFEAVVNSIHAVEDRKSVSGRIDVQIIRDPQLLLEPSVDAMSSKRIVGFEKDPIEQALGYLNRIRNGKVQTASGRQIPNSESIPGFCYILCDITPSVAERCVMHDAAMTNDGLGYFFFHKGLSAFVEIVSFDRLVTGAEQRNRAFFDKLGLPS